MIVFHFVWTQVSRMGDLKKLELIKDKVLKYSCNHYGHQAIRYTVKYFSWKAVGLFEIMLTQDPWNSKYFETFKLLSYPKLENLFNLILQII